MTRIRLSTTVDASLLEQVRNARSWTTDAALVDEALTALLARYRSAEVDASYAAYDEHPLDEPDAWGDPASFRQAASASSAPSPRTGSSGGARWPRPVVDRSSSCLATQ